MWKKTAPRINPLAASLGLACGLLCIASPASATEHGDASVSMSGELKQWHAVALDLSGPHASEADQSPRPFLDYAFFVTFQHESGEPTYTVPGFFAADGDAANSGADAGTVWRAYLSPDKAGTWHYRTHFRKGENAAVDPSAGEAFGKYDGISGTFEIDRSDKTGRDFRAKGRLEYVGKHHLRFAGDGSYFLKVGADAPETMLAFKDIDGTVTRKEKKGPLKDWAPHVDDWTEGDPSWGEGRGKGLIGAFNYLSEVGANAVSFLTYNAAGDGDNVWPFVERDNKFAYDVSKLAQWNVLFSHAQSKGLYLHFKLQEQEMDDNRVGHRREEGKIVEALDGGLLGVERKLYYRELVARFGHHLALNWNLGEENTQSYEEQRDMAAYLSSIDAYGHNLVIHSFPRQQDRVYASLLGTQSDITGVSMQNHWNETHQRTLQWVTASALAGRAWVCANDEQGPASMGVPPDTGYEGFSGLAEWKDEKYTIEDVRKYTLWGNLMAGGAGVEYYFGYKLPQNDLIAQDYRSRHQSWIYGRHALSFFQDNAIPFWRMLNANALVGNAGNENGNFCLAAHNEAYLVYLPEGGEAEIDLSGATGRFKVEWYDAKNGGRLQRGSVRRVDGGKTVSLGSAPKSEDAVDWAILLRR